MPDCRRLTTRPLRRRKLFLGPLPDKGLPKDAKPGCSLAGTLKLAKSSPTAGDRPAPGPAPILVTVPPPPARKEGDEDGDDDAAADDAATPLERLRAARRDADVRCLVLCRTSSHGRDCRPAPCCGAVAVLSMGSRCMHPHGGTLHARTDPTQTMFRNIRGNSAGDRGFSPCSAVHPASLRACM